MLIILNKDVSKVILLWTGLQLIDGFGKIHAMFACIKLGLKRNVKVKDLSRKTIKQLDRILQKYKFVVGRLLEKIIYIQTNMLIETNAYRAIRTRAGLPSRGQRTHTNAKTAKRLRGFWGKSQYAKKMLKLIKRKKKSAYKKKKNGSFEQSTRKYIKKKK